MGTSSTVCSPDNMTVLFVCKDGMNNWSLQCMTFLALMTQTITAWVTLTDLVVVHTILGKHFRRSQE